MEKIKGRFTTVFSGSYKTLKMHANKLYLCITSNNTNKSKIQGIDSKSGHYPARRKNASLLFIAYNHVLYSDTN